MALKAGNLSREGQRLGWKCLYCNVIGQLAMTLNELVAPSCPHRHFFKGIKTAGFPMAGTKFEQAGRRSDHYDILATPRDGPVKRIEFKGVTGPPSRLPAEGTCPWAPTPQLLNLPFGALPSAGRYAKRWYYEFIPKVLERFTDLPPPPDYETWVKYDAAVGGSRRLSAFGAAVKMKRKGSKEDKRAIDELVKESLRVHWRQQTCEEWKELESGLETVFHAALEEKDVWLVATYPDAAALDPTGMCWYPRQRAEKFRAQLSKEGEYAYPKVILHYSLNGNPIEYKGEARLCWRNGNGVANISWHIK